MSPWRLEEEILRALEDRYPDYECLLGEDWRFAEIDADAWRRNGHEHSGWHHGSIDEITVKAIHDLELAFQRLHPNASASAVAVF